MADMGNLDYNCFSDSGGVVTEDYYEWVFAKAGHLVA